MINLYTTSQASFREKRMVFEFEGTSSGVSESTDWAIPELPPGIRVRGEGEVLSTRELRARAKEGSVTRFGLGSLPPRSIGLDASVFASTELDLGLAETSDAIRVNFMSEPAPAVIGSDDRGGRTEAPTSAPAPLDPVLGEAPRVSVTHSAPAVASPTVARTAQSTFVPEKPHQPLSFRQPIAKPTATHAQQPKTGFFSRLMARLTGPTKELNPATTKLRQPAALRERKEEETLPVYPHGSGAATNMPHTAKARLHNTILFDDQNVPASLPLATRLENANSNDIYAYARARNPQFKISFDGKLDGGIFQKIAFAKALAQDPELRACTEELQNRARHVKSVTGKY